MQSDRQTPAMRDALNQVDTMPSYPSIIPSIPLKTTFTVPYRSLPPEPDSVLD